MAPALHRQATEVHDRLMDQIRQDDADMNVSEARADVLRQAVAHVKDFQTKQQLYQGLHKARVFCMNSLFVCVPVNVDYVVIPLHTKCIHCNMSSMNQQFSPGG